MKRIYTRTGDMGMTNIHGGERVPKYDIRIEANGCIDELNAVIGIVRSLLPPEHEWQSLLFTIQKNLMVIMSHVATPSTIRHRNPNELPEDLVALCEETMDKLTLQMKDNGYFILPGGTPLSAQLQFARTVGPPYRTKPVDAAQRGRTAGSHSPLHQPPFRLVLCDGALRDAATELDRREMAVLCLQKKTKEPG